jgi:O-antigen/teichoic acid export membrane protein
MTRIQQAIVRGLHAIVTGQIAEIFVRPLLFVILLLVFSYAVSSAANALWLNLVASLVAFLMAFILLRRNLSTELLHHESRYELRLWLSAALPFMLVAVLEVVNNRLDLLMLGSMRGPEAAGILNVSKRLAELTTFALLSVNITLAPSIAKLHMQEKSDDLQQLVTKSSRLILLGTLPITLFLLIFGIPLLSLWGETYQVGYSTLVILCLAQLLNAFMGPVALILNMTGRERYVALSLAVTLLLNYGLNMLLIPTYSFTGAAVATATAVLCWNVLMALWVYRTLGVYTPSLGSRFFRTLQHHA